MKLFILLTLFISSLVSAQVVGDRNLEYTSATGADYATNFILNPSARKNTSNTATSNAAIARVTSAGYKIDGVSSYSCDASALNGYCEFTLDAIRNPADEGNCEFKGRIKGDGTLYQAQILDGSANVLSSTQVLGNQSLWTAFSVNFPCSSSRKVRVTQTVAGTAPIIYLGKLYYGQATNVGANIPPNTLSAQVSAAGVVSLETGGDWINGNCAVSDTSVFNCTLTTSFLVNTPTCNLTTANTGDTAAVPISITSTTMSATNIVYRIAVNGVKTAHPVMINCTKTGSDFLQNAITARNYDYDWTAYTPTLNSTTGVSSRTFFHERKGGSIHIKGSIAFNGTGAAGTLTIALPSGLTIDTNRTFTTGTAGLGFAWWYDNGVAHKSVSVLYATTTTIQLAATGTGSVINSSTVGNGDNITVDFTVPITNWTETQNAPQLLNSVITQYSGVNNKIESELNCDASSSITAQSGGIATIGNRSGATCALTITAGVFSTSPWKCSVTVKSTTVQSMGCSCSSATACTIAGPSADYDAYVSIEGPK